MKKVFLGGTCNESTWRNELISMLKIDYFNPVVDDWTEECMQEERIQREICDYCLYVITPLMTGVYSIAEVIDDSNKRPERTIFCVLGEDTDPTNNLNIGFGAGQIRSLNQVGEMVKRNGGKYFKSLEEVARYLNKENNIKVGKEKMDIKENKYVKSFEFAGELLEKGYTITAITKDPKKFGRHLIWFKNENGLEDLIKVHQDEYTRRWRENHNQEVGK